MAASHDRASQRVDITDDGLRALLEYVSEAILCCSGDGTIRFASEAMRDLTDIAPEALVGRNVVSLLHPDDHEHAINALARWDGRQGTPTGRNVRIGRADGSWIEVRYDASIGESFGGIGSLILTLRRAGDVDLTELGLRSRALNEERIVRFASTFVHSTPEMFDAALEAGLQSLAGLEDVTRVTIWRASDDRLILQARWDAPTNAPNSDVPPRIRTSGLQALREVSEGGEVEVSLAEGPNPRYAEEIDMMERAGLRCFLSVPMLSSGELVGMIQIESTVAERFSVLHRTTLRSAASILAAAFLRHDAEVELARQARTDRVTGLENRWAFDERLRDALARVADGTSAGVGLAIIDLDRFKVINDSFGHTAGDRLLTDLASRLVRAANSSTCIARMGGDEILVLVDDVDDRDKVLATVDELLTAVAVPFDVAGTVTLLNASAGVTHTTRGDLAPDELLRWADVALYEAKDRGGGRAVLDDPAGHALRSAGMRRETELQRAVRNDELTVHFQGEWDLRTAKLVGAEALVRWDHPTEGLLSAGEFVPVAEESGLINELGRQVLRQACATAAPWVDALGGTGFQLRVNVAAHQLREGDLVALVSDVLEDTGLPATALCLELTESALLTDAGGSADLFARLREMGVGLAIDDFGTGYSSFLQLRSLPLSALKIDQRFVGGLPHNETDAAIVRATLDLAQVLGITATAEGVETTEQRDALIAMGCRRAQGFLLSRPVPADELERQLAL